MNRQTESGDASRVFPRKLLWLVLLSIMLTACFAPASGMETELNTQDVTESEESLSEAATETIREETSATESASESTETGKKSVTEVTIQSHVVTEGAPGIDPTTGGVVHTVRSGETLLRIAALYSVYPDDIVAWNQLSDPDRLTAGSRLVIREPGTGPDSGEPVSVKTESPKDAPDNTAYGWSYPASSDVESLVNSYGGYSRILDADNQLILTFDCGYSYKDFAVRILDTLKNKNIKATFFVTGAFLEKEPETVVRMLNEGHTVGNHTMMHLNAPEALGNGTSDALVSDMLALEEFYRTVTGKDIHKFVRPPEGSWSERSLSLYQDLGYTTLFWDLTYRDWETDNQVPAPEALALLKDQTRDGAVILLHAISETNVQILGDYIDWAVSRGYRFVAPGEVLP